MRRVALSLAGLAIAGCGANTSSLFVQLPDTNDQAAIVILAGERDVQAHAIDLESERKLQVDEWSEAGTLSIEVLLYDATLLALGIRPGRIQLTEPQLSDITLPTPRVAYVATDADPELVLSTPSLRSQDLRMTSILNPCRDFIIDSFVLSAANSGMRVRAYDGESALGILTVGREAFLLREDGFQTLTSTIPVITAAFAAGNGTYWFGGPQGHIWRGEVVADRLEATLVHAVEAPPGGLRPDWRWIDGGVVGDEMELTLLGGDGRAMRYRAGQFEDLHQFETASKGNAVWLGPGRAMFVSGDDSRLLSVDGDRIQRRGLPNNSEGINGIEDLGELGLHAMAGPGLTYQFTDINAINRLEDSPIALNNYTVARTGDRLVFGATRGFIAEYVLGVGFCDEIQIAPETIRAVVPLDSGAMILETQDLGVGNPTRYFVIKPR